MLYTNFHEMIFDSCGPLLHKQIKKIDDDLGLQIKFQNQTNKAFYLKRLVLVYEYSEVQLLVFVCVYGLYVKHLRKKYVDVKK